MDVSVDELAGIVDPFGGLSREELERALTELAYRAGGDTVDEAALEETIEVACETFALVRYTPVHRQDEPLFVVGPTAFPTLPDNGEDLPYILDIDRRSLDREAIGVQLRVAFLEELEETLEAGDLDRARELLDVSYDIEAWAPVDLSDERDRLDELLE